MKTFFVRLKTAASHGIGGVSARLKRATPRERLLLAILALGGLTYAPVAAMNWRADQEDAYVSALSERSAARLSQQAARRVQAAAGDAAALEDMRNWGFEASNTEVLRVRLEQQLTAAATAAGMQGYQITVDGEPEAIGPTRWLNAQVRANLQWTPTFALLDELGGWPEGFRVRGFDYTVAQPTARPGGRQLNQVRIDLAFPIRSAETAS